jgi:hypothetical protein
VKPKHSGTELTRKAHLRQLKAELRDNIQDFFARRWRTLAFVATSFINYVARQYPHYSRHKEWRQRLRQMRFCAAPGDVVLTQVRVVDTHVGLALAQPLPVAAPEKIG